MGQKVSPIGLRIGINQPWTSNWYAEGEQYGAWIAEDIKIRQALHLLLKKANVSKITIERSNNDQIKVNIKSARSGIVLGQAGKNIPVLVKAIQKAIHDRKRKISINVIEIKNMYLDAQLLANWIADQIANRAFFRIVQKLAIRKARAAGVLGIKTQVAGRLGGTDMARTEGYTEGTVPLTTLRSNVDYGMSEALTVYGQISCKVWLYKGVLIPGKEYIDPNINTEPHKKNQNRDHKQKGRRDHYANRKKANVRNNPNRRPSHVTTQKD